MLLLSQLRALREQGYDVTGISAPGDGVAELEAAGISHFAVPFVRNTQLTPLADANALAHMVRVFRRGRFDIVHTHTAKPDLYAAMAARLAGVPCVVSTLHGFLFHELTPPKRRRFYAGLAKVGMRFCDTVLSQNPEDVTTAIAERICPASKIEYLGNGIDLTRFDPTRIDAQRVRGLKAELGIAPDSLTVGFVGRLVEEKGVLELFAAIAQLRLRFPTIKLLIVGMIDRAKSDAIQPEVADRFGIADLCIFTGHRDDMPELYSAMDVCVLASHREGYPRTVMEASAMSVPVVATNIRGCRTAVVEGRNGMLVPLKDPAKLAEAIGALLGDPARRRSIARQARTLAEGQFDERVVFAHVLATYDRLLSSRGDSRGIRS